MIRRFARPYARAIMDVAGSPTAANALRGELLRFESALRDSLDLRAFYANPGISLDAKLGVTRTLAKRMKLSAQPLRTLEVLVRFGRINDLGSILSAVAEYVNAALGVAVAHVRSAKTLTPDEMEHLAGVLGEKVGKSVELDVRTDPSLLGGFIARIGSEIYDASVAGKINRFRESLTQP